MWPVELNKKWNSAQRGCDNTGRETGKKLVDSDSEKNRVIISGN